MARAIETGMQKMRIEEAAARKQARIDRGEDVIVGVNKYPPEREERVDILKVDNRAVRDEQVERLEHLRETRDEALVERTLAALEEGARGDANLLALTLPAVRARATVGEISLALERVFGRHQADRRLISGVYGGAYEGADGDALSGVRARVEAFLERAGRRPRMLVVKMGQDGHDRGAKVVATAFADLGFDVDVGPLFQTPEETARQAVENDVHIVGVSSLAAGHKTLLPQLVAELRKLGREGIMVVVGGVIPSRDYAFLREHGAAAVFGPGTVIPQAAREILAELNRRLGYGG
jgi:methylmalonyl-CoA mutase